MKFLDKKGCRKSEKLWNRRFSGERMKEHSRAEVIENKNPLRMLRDPEG